MIEKREKRKKIFYVPGMISLIFIPLISVIYFFKTDSFKVDSCLAISVFSCGYYEANKSYFLEMEKERKFQYIVSLYKKYGIIFLGYLGIAVLNIFALVKINKNQNYNQK